MMVLQVLYKVAGGSGHQRGTKVPAVEGQVIYEQGELSGKSRILPKRAWPKHQELPQSGRCESSGTELRSLSHSFLMASSLLYTVLESYIDIPFNVWLSIILIFTYWCAVRNRGLLLLVVLGISAIIVVFDKTSTVGEMTKIMCELPLGLGSVLAFLVANRSFQARFLPVFTTYVNFAVYGNIGMMVGTPADGTLRGICSKVTCITLFIWIVQQGYRAGWKTIIIHDDLFVFTAVSKSWIFAHAIYRFVLLTLPCFGSGRRHRLLELYSLTLTFTLSSTSNLPFEYCFGLADTLVVPAVAGWSAIATTFNLIPRDAIDKDLLANRIGTDADAYLSALSLAVAIFTCFKIASPPPQGSRGA